MYRKILLIILCLIPVLAKSQNERAHIREGNDYYEKQDFKGAEEAYKKARKINRESYEAEFNLGTALYKQGKYPEAAKQFEKLTTLAIGRDQKAMIYYNYGNALLKSEMIMESISAYKTALKIKPDEEDARYNLAYALSLLKDIPLDQQSVPEETQQILDIIEEEERAVKRKMQEAKVKVPKTGKDW